jgi:hypothetical protein
MEIIDGTVQQPWEWFRANIVPRLASASMLGDVGRE